MQWKNAFFYDRVQIKRRVAISNVASDMRHIEIFDHIFRIQNPNSLNA